MRAFAIVTAAWLGVNAPAQVYTTDAGVQSPTLTATALRADWLDRRRGEELQVEASAVWSPSRTFETKVLVPWIHRRGRFDAGGGNFVLADRAGLGDVQLYGKWGLVREDDVMQSDRVSLLGAVSLPTGESDATVGGVAVPRREQLGLGALGGMLGAGVTFVRDRHRFASALQAWFHESDDGFEPAPTLRWNTAWWYRLAPVAFAPERDEHEWRVATELLADWRTDDRLDGVDQGDGGLDLLGSVGLQLHTSTALRFEVAVRLPLVQEIDSAYGDTELGLTCSVRLFF